MYFSITKEIRWHMGHRVPHHKSKCRSIHGHSYLLKAHVTGNLSEEEGTSEEGMVIDFGDVKQIMVDRVYNHLDHACMLWEGDSLVPALEEDADTRLVKVSFIPTAENIARWCYETLQHRIMVPGERHLRFVEVYETPTSCAKYPGGALD